MIDSPRISLDSRTPGANWSSGPSEPSLLLTCDAARRLVTLRDRNDIVRKWDDPLAALDWMPRHLNEICQADARWIGFLSYDLGRLFEKLPSRAVNDLHLPLFAFALHLPQQQQAWRAREHPVRASGELSSNFSRERYIEAVARTIDYIAAGDVFQVNLSQRFTAPLTERPWSIYERLQRRTPALYGACLDLGEYALLCNSPSCSSASSAAKPQAAGDG